VKFPNARIIVFAKAPVPGKCKTRLIPALGSQGAADLHTQLVHHTLNTVTSAKLSPVELWCAYDTNHPFFIGCDKQYPLAVKQQYGRDLGERMENSFRETLKTAPYAVLIGTDCPTLTKQDINDTLQALNDGSCCTLHPANDGGYVAIGLSKVSSRLFSNINWGQSSVYEETRQRLEQLEWPWKKLATHDDIDRPEDLKNLNTVKLSNNAT